MAKKIAFVLGIVFVLVGVLGFVPNPIVGMTGIFETDMLHNLVHLLFGIILIVASKKGAAMLWLKILGVAYLVLAVLGFLMVPEGGALLGLVHTNAADHYLHVVLGVVLVVAGFMGGRSQMPATPVM